jgi:hypothetical protein
MIYTPLPVVKPTHCHYNEIEDEGQGNEVVSEQWAVDSFAYQSQLGILMLR